MQCPVCDVTLSISSREGVEIDFCPQCRGVWLDRGELDKVIERAGTAYAAQTQPSAPPPSAPRERYEDRGGYRDDRSDRGPAGHDDDYRRKKKRRDFLEDLFDF